MLKPYHCVSVPRWPQMQFDASKRRAYLSVRYADWRSHARGCRCTEILVCLGYAACGWLAYQAVPIYAEIQATLLGWMVVWGVSATCMRTSFRLLLPKFLARRIFGTRLRVWMIPTAIAIDSRLYEKPFRVPRQWSGTPLNLQFISVEDPEDTEHRHRSRPKAGERQIFQEESKLIQLLIRSPDQPRGSEYSDSECAMRCYPIASVRQRDVSKFTIVLNTASRMTREQNQFNDVHKWTQGVDIDIRESFERNI